MEQIIKEILYIKDSFLMIKLPIILKKKLFKKVMMDLHNYFINIK